MKKKKAKKPSCVNVIDVLTDRVGPGGQLTGIQVQRVQELLKLAGYFTGEPSKTRKWDQASSDAMTAFQKDFGRENYQTSINDYIEPDPRGHKLQALAWKAGVVSWVPSYCRGKPAVLALYETLRQQKIPYGWTQNGKKHHGGSRMVWGWEDYPQLVVYTTAGSNPDDLHFRTDYPKTLNCTSFANLMLSVWVRGDAHGAPYIANQGVGAMNPLGKRYNMPPVPGGIDVDKSGGVFSNFDKLKKRLQPGKMYHIALYTKGVGITHDMVLLDDTIYQCNLNQGKGNSSVYSVPLEKKFRDTINAEKGKYIQVLGPAPG
jgi:hypothetical protein